MPIQITHSGPKTYPEIKTSKGKVYKDCKVVRSDTDALIFEYGNGTGVAKVSFFDLDEEIQKEFNFDPVAGMAKYKQNIDAQRDLRWQIFWANQKNKTKKQSQQNQLKKIQEIKKTWIPIKAKKVLSVQNKDGIFVQAKKLTYVKTKTKSKLGFEIDGPAVKKLVPFEPQVIFLEIGTFEQSSWDGYVAPIPNGTILHPYDSTSEIPRYQAVARSEIHD